MTPAWGRVKLRVVWGDVPQPPTVLRMRTGRRYQVLAASGRTIHCLVLPKDHKTGHTPVVDWQWAPRKPGARRRGPA